MKRILTLILFLATTIVSWADDSGTCGENLIWTYVESTNTLTISGSGAMKNYFSSNYPWYSYRNDLNTIIIENGVTSIGYNAFSGCTGLTSVTIGNGVTSIGGFAFSGCTGLTSIEIPNSVTSIGGYAFEGCTGLTSIEIPNSVTSIGDYAFSSCTGLTKVIVPDIAKWCNISFFDSYANPLSYAHHLYSDENTEITELVIPEGVTSIGNYAFCNCEDITSVVIPKGVNKIGDNTFSGMKSLSSLLLPEGLTTIGSYAFAHCSSIKEVVLPEGLTSFGSNVFAYCTSIESVSFPSTYGFGADGRYGSSYSGPRNTFTGVSCLKKVYVHSRTLLNCMDMLQGMTQVASGFTWYVPKGLRDAYYQYSFPYVRYDKGIIEMGEDNDIIEFKDKEVERICIEKWDANYSGTLDKEEAAGVLGFSEGVFSKATFEGSSIETFEEFQYFTNLKNIKNGMFKNCSRLTTITLPNSVTSIGEWAFDGCTGLTSIEIPNSVTAIGSGAFYDCTGLTSITIPNSVTSIGNYAFYGCTGLTSVTIGNSVTSIGEGAFSGCTGLTSITIPNSVTSIGYGAFRNCTGLTSVLSQIENPFAFESMSFAYISPLCTLTVPVGTRDAYINYGWTTSVFKGGIIDLSDPEDIYVENGSSFMAHTIEGIDLIFTILDITQCAVRVSSVSSSTVSSVTIPETVHYGHKDYTVTTIHSSAFSRCTGLTSITIPNSVTSIGNSAFSGCTGLTKVIVPDIAKWCNISFSDGGNPLCYAHHLYSDENTEITELIIPEGVTSIGYSAFQNCTGLTSITIPNSVTSIGTDAFSGCTGLTSITIPNSVTSIGYGAFYGCTGLTSITIPNSVTSIGYYAFNGCTGLTSVTIPNSVTSIGNYAFNGCTGLTSVTIGSGVTSIGEGAFYGCTGLTSVIVPDIAKWCNISFSYGGNPLCYAHHLYSDENTEITELVIPEGVTSIGNVAFSGCTGLTSITIPNSVTSIGEGAFSGCTGLTSIEIPNSVTSIGYGAFRNCTGLTSIEIPNSVTSIEDDAFYGCTGLTKVIVPDIAKWCNISFSSSDANPLSYAHHLYSDENTEITELVIPEGVTSIGNVAFQNCTGLTSIEIPNSVTSIGESAFYDCKCLTSVTIGNGVTSIGEYTFYGCTGLTSVKVANETPPSISSSTFSNRANATLYVPAGSKASYEAADYWKDFKKIVDTSFNLVFIVDGEQYKSYEIEEGENVTQEPAPTKFGYTFSGWSEIPETMPAHDVTVTGTFEEHFDVSHVVTMVNFLMSTNVAAEDIAYYDMNDDGDLNIGDIILIVKSILNHGGGSAGSPMRRASGIVDFAQYTATQFELAVDKNASIKDIRLISSMAQSHQLMYQQKDEHTYAVVIYSLSNQLMSPENGNIIEVESDGGGVMMQNIIVATPSGESYYYPNGGIVTKVSPLSSKKSNEIYDLKGYHLNESDLQKGVYIINGKKVVVK